MIDLVKNMTGNGFHNDMMYLSEYLNKIGKEGNHWMNYHIIMGYIKEYEEKYNIKILFVVDDKK